ncbi:hypothetical protein EII17_01330 [Clostridiales bacterium COT073_COT-073]|nr:hypothetical protein EII17_01330 [Clostridiales bacterium COT073_COT-073]
MNKIANYVNNLFYAYPKTEENARLKNQILDSLQSKYQHYLAQGMNEDAAFGKAISDFGQIGELMPSAGPETIPIAPAREPSPKLQAAMDAYQNYLTTFRFMIAGGIFLCILAIVLSSSINSFYSEPYDNIVTTAAFFLPIAIAVTLFVISSLKHSHLKKMVLILSRQENYFAYMEYFADSDDLISTNSGNPYSRYMASGNHFNSASHPTAKFCPVIIMSALIIFLILGFIYDLWHPGWIVFPIGGLLCGIVSILLRNNK